MKDSPITINIELNKSIKICGILKVEEATSESIVIKLTNGSNLQLTGSNFDIQNIDSETKSLLTYGSVEKVKLQNKKKMNLKSSILK